MLKKKTSSCTCIMKTCTKLFVAHPNMRQHKSCCNNYQFFRIQICYHMINNVFCFFLSSPLNCSLECKCIIKIGVKKNKVKKKCIRNLTVLFPIPFFKNECTRYCCKIFLFLLHVNNFVKLT